ncbi:protein kinase [Streptomyces sp. NBC_00820]|uniref:serine/threonine-protein kinase n=1 Tax=Streptomyces sp. NBC_00820 TaxID=2975842 RepID=UPI002ED259F8|nr:protein kinase [Streptomyces sp. NBC_00820]
MEKLEPGDPQRIGGYRLLARLGSGGMGNVYLARSDRGRTVAVKLVRRELAQQEEFRARFRREVGAARRVGGYWTAPVLDADTEAPVPWVATGYVAGPSLQQVVGHDHGALPERSVRILAAGLAHALKDVHAAGIVHRDLKPSNVLVTIDGPRVIDFGIARALETVAGEGLTVTGSLVGSPGFMAPEQVRGDRVTPACDVFCLGSVLAYAATGVLPFGDVSSGVHALMFRIAQEEPDLTGVPEGIADLVRECLRKDPAARPSLDVLLERVGAEQTVSDGRARDPWLPGALVAQLGRHAVGLLEVEDPEGGDSAGAGAGAGAGSGSVVGADSVAVVGEGAGSGVSTVPSAGFPPAPLAPPVPPAPSAAVSSSGAGRPGPVDVPSSGAGRPGWGDAAGAGSAGAEHAAVADGGAGPATPGADAYVPTWGTGQATPPGAPPGYGYPQHHPQTYPQAQAQAPAGYGYPPQSYVPPSYGPPPAGTGERGNGRSTVLLVVIALVVALGAGGSVYALLSHGGKDTGTRGGAPATGGGASASTASGASAPATPDASASGSASPPAGGVIPAAYLGTWETSIDNDGGANTRKLTIAQGKAGDTVLTLVADGPTDGGGSYHCVFEAKLAEAPAGNGPLEMGPSTVVSGAPASSCSPGEATEVTLQPDGRLKRAKRSGAESLTYSRR